MFFICIIGGPNQLKKVFSSCSVVRWLASGGWAIYGLFFSWRGSWDFSTYESEIWSACMKAPLLLLLLVSKGYHTSETRNFGTFFRCGSVYQCRLFLNAGACSNFSCLPTTFGRHCRSVQRCKWLESYSCQLFPNFTLTIAPPLAVIFRNLLVWNEIYHFKEMQKTKSVLFSLPVTVVVWCWKASR